MTTLTMFDTVLTKIIGKLTRGLHPFFDRLGYMTMPVVWIMAVSSVILYRFLSEEELLTEIIVLVCIPIATVLKLFIRRQRPMTIYAEAMKVKSYSFPSSHAYSAALVCGYFSSLAFASGHSLIGSIFISLAMLIGISRVHLGAHYPSDVLVGWLLGASFLWIALSV